MHFFVMNLLSIQKGLIQKSVNITISEPHSLKASFRHHLFIFGPLKNQTLSIES